MQSLDEPVVEILIKTRGCQSYAGLAAGVWGVALEGLGKSILRLHGGKATETDIGLVSSSEHYPRPGSRCLAFADGITFHLWP